MGGDYRGGDRFSMINVPRQDLKPLLFAQLDARHCRHTGNGIALPDLGHRGG